MRPTSDGVIIFGVPLWSPAFVSASIHEKIDAVGAFLALVAAISDGRVAHYTHRVTAVTCSLTSFLHFIPTANSMMQRNEFGERQSAWLERICNILRSAAA